MSSGEDRPSKGRDRRLLLVAAGTALALIVLIVVTTARSTPILQAPDRDPNVHLRLGTFQPPSRLVSMAGKPTSKGSEAMGHTFGTFLLDILLGLVLLGLLWLLAAIAMSVIRRWRDRRRAAQQAPLPEVDDAVLDAVTRATHRQEQQLREGAPSDAIVACWVDLERSVATAGVERRPSETSAELTMRVLDALDVDRRSLRTLGALYREARYSAHPLTEQERTAALHALRTLRRSLPAAQERV